MVRTRDTKFILWFNEISIGDVPLVGGKNASLGEMYQKLISKGVNIPGGFAITAYAYRYLIKEAHIEETIKDALAGLNTHDMDNLKERGQRVRAIIRNADFPPDLTQAIVESYHRWRRTTGKEWTSQYDRLPPQRIFLMHPLQGNRRPS